MPKLSTTYSPLGAEELVFGLVYGAGTETDAFQRLLRDSLRGYGYRLRSVHLSDYFPHLLDDSGFQSETPDATRKLQDMGDTIRNRSGLNDILARLALYLIASRRTREGAPSGRVAWLVRSLKRKEEVATLRRVYGPRFILLALHVPESTRLRNLEHRWERWANVTGRRFDAEAIVDIRRDEMDRSNAYGQGVLDTFSIADIFIDGRSDASLTEVIPRVARLIFGEPFVPPYREEQGMHHAYTAGLRSSEMGRQVGAAILNRAGDVLSVGTNEVPSGRGGLYWSPDQPDERDFARQPPLDSNTLWQRKTARELLVKMAHAGWMDKQRITTLSPGDYDITEDTLDRFLSDVDGTRFSWITEFGRAVHAEMDAITSAARRGVAIDGSTLLCTTFPCHNCARHIIASGVDRVVYLHPYAKSLARELHDDAIIVEPEQPGSIDGRVVFEQYVGVSPRVYEQYFDFGQASRKGDRGRAMASPTPDAAIPRVLESAGSFTFGGPTLPASRSSELERELTEEFVEIIERCSDLTLPIPSDKEDES